MTRKGFSGLLALLVVLLVCMSVAATDAEMYFSADKNGQTRVTNVQEGDEIFIVIYDPDQNIDCDIRDKFTGDTKIMDPKTGAYIVWNVAADFDFAAPTGDYFEETGADTGLFVSHRAFQIGTRESFAAGSPERFTHVVDTLPLDDFSGGHYLYGSLDGVGYADRRGYFGGSGGLTFHGGRALYGIGEIWRMPSYICDLGGAGEEYLVGRFENMDTLIGMFQDPNDATDVAVAMMKIIDTEATIAWDETIYKDGNGAATITIVDADENLNCSEVECVPVFILVNPGSWNPLDAELLSPTSFCALKRTGGVTWTDAAGAAPVGCSGAFCPIRWYDIYNSKANFKGSGSYGAQDGRYYIQYDPALFDTTAANGVTAVSFYAWETGVSTGVFQLNLNSILTELGFDSLRVRDVLVAYYLDPNDEDDFKLATAYIEERQHSATSFTDATRGDMTEYWLGRDPVYVQVIDSNANIDPCCPEQVVVHICDPHGEDDSEWLILDETSSNSPVFFTFAGTQLWPVWDALGVGLSDSIGGFQLQLDNWKLEAFNEDDIYVRYNDVYYGATETTTGSYTNDPSSGLSGLGDQNWQTSFPPYITKIRVANDVSFDLMSIGDTQVWDGSTTTMYFLDRSGNRVSGYVNSDCVFVEVIDYDQDEDQYRRERIDGYWDGAQNVPFGPMALNEFVCNGTYTQTHSVNVLLGDTNIFNDTPAQAENSVYHGEAKLYILNPRSGRWAAVDLLETAIASGDFVSVTCIDLVSVYSTCVPTLDVLPGDTIVAFYQDPSNHSDSAMISIKVGVGGSTTPSGQASTTTFVDEAGVAVTSYTDIDLVYVKVIDPTHAGDSIIADAVEIDGVTYDLAPLAGANTDTFITAGLDLGLAAGESVTAMYTDPLDSTDTSSDTITIIASELDVDSFYAGPNPCDGECTFGYNGSGVASVMSVSIYDLSGHLVWKSEQANVTEIVWSGTNASGCGAGERRLHLRDHGHRRHEHLRRQGYGVLEALGVIR